MMKTKKINFCSSRAYILFFFYKNYLRGWIIDKHKACPKCLGDIESIKIQIQCEGLRIMDTKSWERSK